MGLEVYLVFAIIIGLFLIDRLPPENHRRWGLIYILAYVFIILSRYYLT